MSDKINLLLVEDEAIDQHHIKRLIVKRELPYRLVLVETIADAREQLQQHSFDVALVDYNLTDGTAFDLLQDEYKVPIIVITGMGDERIAVEALQQGAFDYICKDIQGHYLEVLPQIIRNTLQRKKTKDELKAYQEKLELLVEERAQELKQERERLAVTLAELNDGVIAVDTQGHITLFNKAAEELSGYTLAEVNGQSIQSLLSVRNEKDASNECKTPLCKVLTTGTTQVGQDWDILVGKNKQEHPISTVATPIYGECQTMIGAVMVVRDDARKREMDHLKEEFLATISHELRTPLSIIMGAVKLVLNDTLGPVADEQREVLETARNNITRLSKIVDSLLDISKLEAAQMNVHSQPTSIHATIEEVIQQYQTQAEEKKITLDLALSPDDYTIDLDTEKIQKALGHLIANGIRFTPESGTITVHGSEQDGEYIISVEDNGIGIA
ncbi:MAG: response regulator, partial [Desulfobacterales bacterium]|nr:response regulator [Desulfobacterales bacterium]